MKPFKLSDLDFITKVAASDAHRWYVSAEESIEFLRSNAIADEIVIYASTNHALIHGALAPIAQVTPPNAQDLQNKFIDLDDTWRIQRVWGGGEDHRIYLEAPLESSAPKSLSGGEKLIFRRFFEGLNGRQNSLELSQKLIHCLELHYVAERSAYCRLDARGDIEDVIRVLHAEVPGFFSNLDVVTILRKDLERFMAVTHTALVLRFDFTRVNHSSFSGWGNLDHSEIDEPDLVYHGGRDTNGSYVNGAMIVRPSITVEDLVQEWKDSEDPTKREYATFKIFDRKNQKDVETSCGPDYLSNYFQKSDLPWEISPAFFKPEVLHRFKADPEKYDLEDRSITCRGAWYLKSYDVNEEGLVHAYIGDLANLPIEEQRYWQSFNVWPKGTISQRAEKTDIRGDWDTTYDPLSSLKIAIRELDVASLDWWKPRGEELSTAARYPLSESPKEWADEIMALDQLLVEGFQVKALKALAATKGVTIESSWASLRVLQELLTGFGKTKEEAEALMQPMKHLHYLRTPLKGHAAVSDRKALELKAKTDFGTFRAHFTHIAENCDRTFREVLGMLGVSLKS